MVCAYRWEKGLGDAWRPGKLGPAGTRPARSACDFLIQCALPHTAGFRSPFVKSGGRGFKAAAERFLPCRCTWV